MTATRSTRTYVELLLAAERDGTVNVAGSRTLDVGWGIHGWIEDTVAGRRFYAGSDVQWAYTRLGWEGVIVRCDDALEVLPVGDELAVVWQAVRDAAVAELEEVTR